MNKSIQSRTDTSFKWLLLELGSIYVIRFGTNIVSTRFLEPDSFGLIGITTSLVAGLCLLLDIGLIKSLYRRQNVDSEIFLCVLWTLRILQGLCIFIFAMIFIFVIYNFGLTEKITSKNNVFAHKDFFLLLVFSTIIPVITSFESPNKYVAARNLDFRLAVVTGISAQTFMAIVTVYLSYTLSNVWALYIGTLVSHCLNVINSHVFFRGPKMRLRYSSKIFEELWNYGKWIGLSSIFTFAETNIQRIFIATSLSAIGFGIYSIALVWIESMLSVVRLITNRLAPPAFAEAMRMKVEDFQVLFDGMQIKLDLIILSFSTCIILFADTIFDFFYMGEYRNVSRMLLALTPLLLQFRFETFFQLQVMLGNGSASSRVTMLRLWGLVAVVFMIPEQVDGAYLLLIVSSASFVSQPYSLILCWKFISPLQKCLSILWFFLYAGIFIILQNKFSAS